MPLLDVKEAIVIEKLVLQKELDELFVLLEQQIVQDEPVNMTFTLGNIRIFLYVMGINPSDEPRYVSLTRLIKYKYDLDFVPGFEPCK